MKVLVVGAGFSGAVIARELFDGGHSVTVIDKRHHIGGNAYDTIDRNGVLRHEYGPHIFHTNSERVFRWLSRFTKWRPYEHRVRAIVEDMDVPFPINRNTLFAVFGRDLKDEQEATAFLDSIREPQAKVTNVEEHVLDSVGRRLYELFFKGYTTKQWGRDPREIKARVAARIPVRTNTDDRYFSDEYQCMPASGYTEMFNRILDGIDVRLSVTFDHSMEDGYDHVVYTGPIDEYYDFVLGRLPYRSLKFVHLSFPVAELLQPVGTMNYPGEEVPFTRVTEFRHLTGQDATTTSLCIEFPSAEGERYYPVATDESEALYRQYRELAKKDAHVTFCGRLGSFKYYNMDQVVAEALATAKEIMA